MKAIISSPANIFPPTPKLFVILTAALSDARVPPGFADLSSTRPSTSNLAWISTLSFDESNFKSPVVVLIVVPSVNPSVILFALTLPWTLNWVAS